MTLMEAVTIVLGVGRGGALGWLLDRSAFSLDRVFRWAVLRDDLTWFRAYALALALLWLVIGVAALGPWRDLGQPFAVSPLASMLAGFVAGLAIGLLADCPLTLAHGAGRTGLRSGAGFLAWIVGVLLGTHGPLARFFERIQLAGPSEWREMRVADLLGVPQWLLLLASGAAVFVWLQRAPVRVAPGTLEWPKQGAGLALLTLVGWALARWGGELGGLNAVDVVEEGWGAATGGRLWLAPSLLAGAGFVAWGFLRSLARRELFLEPVGSAVELVILAAAGVLLGLASALAGGDPATRLLFGMSVLHLGSAIFTLAMCCGAWLVGIMEWKQLGRPGGKPARGRPVET